LVNNKILANVLSGNKDSNIRFTDLCKLLGQLGFARRVKGDHFIYAKQDIPDILNIQPNGNKAKAYQVKQVRLIINRYNLTGGV